jgi:hypothetical protein
MDFSYDLGWFWREHKSELVFMPKNRRKAINFVELIYDRQLLQFMDKVSCGILIEDGAHVHCSRAPEEWRKLCLIKKLDWPSNSLDLNPLENVWKLLKDAVQHGQTCPRNLEELTMTLQREWRSISSVKLCNLCHSMLVRLQSEIEAKEDILVGEFAINPF